MTTIRILFLIILSLLHGCATIFNSKAQVIKVSTTENKTAKAVVMSPNTAAYQAMLPDVIYAKPSSFEELSIQIDDPCYQQTRVTVNKSITPVYWANIFTYFIGFTIDYVAGTMWDYDNGVQLPLIPSNTKDSPCEQENKKPENFNAFPIPEPRIHKHRISAGFGSKVHSQRYEDSYSGFGPYFEYTYLLDSEFMLNARFQFNYSTEYYYDIEGCGNHHGSCTTDISTDQGVMAISLRRYLSPSSNFYTGLGVAQVSVGQTYYDYGYDEFNYASDGKEIDATSHAIFLDLGWQSRKGTLSLNVNGMLDLAELRLSSPDFYYDKDDLSIYANKSRKNQAVNRFRNAGLISNISLGLTLAF